jgi:hypothetical protein
MIDSANDMRTSLNARCDPEKYVAVRAGFEAVVMTYLNVRRLPASYVQAFGIQKCNYGLGLWDNLEARHRHEYASLPSVDVKFKLKPDGVLGVRGSAKMTDRLLDKIEDLHGKENGFLNEFRDELIGDSVLSAAGTVKFQGRVRTNVEKILARLAQHHKRRGVWRFYAPGEQVETFGMTLAMEFGEILADTVRLRAFEWLTAPQIIQRTLMRTKSHSIGIYKKLTGALTDMEAYSALTSSGLPAYERAVMSAVWNKPYRECELFVRDELMFTFWEEYDVYSSTVCALVQRFVLHKMTVNKAFPLVPCTRDVPIKVKLTMTGVELCKIVAKQNSEVLRALSY